MPRPGRYWPDTRHNSLPRPEHWSRHAVCRELDPAMFFPEGEGGATALIVEEAKGYCRSCPVMHECLEEALDRAEPAGVWGGLDEDERRNLLRPPADPAAIVPAEDTSDARAPAA